MVLLTVLLLATFVAASPTDSELVRASSPSASLDSIIPPASKLLPLVSQPRSMYKKQLVEGICRNLPDHFWTTSLAGSSLDQEYLANVTIGGQNFSLIVDTGSSDTWVAMKGFKCFNMTSGGESQSPSECGFGSEGFDPSKSSTFEPYADVDFNISYSDGGFMVGNVGYDTVSVGGMTVTHQEIGLVTHASWHGDEINTGLLGLAYPGLTSVHDRKTGDQVIYDPLFFSAVKQSAVPHPCKYRLSGLRRSNDVAIVHVLRVLMGNRRFLDFSIALNRGTFSARSSPTYDPKLGYLGFGGYVPVPTTYPTVTVPVLVDTQGTPKYFFWTVEIDSYIFPGSSALKTSSNATILDTGTTLNFLPTHIARAYNSKFSPPATYVASDGVYYVHCNAKVPEFSVKIGSKAFSIDARDQVVPTGSKDGNGEDICISGTQDGGPGNTFVLGDVFLHNVVSTYNIHSNQITLSQRAPY
ncbi:aspartic peptidase domain-containing protein [Cantharellus anzutake]|uniref:aspartic peptidase domain-containing protein n=1 Tax=Cantharellus anzutake TaxID=1750568 RepID=UPI00190334D0|nr:aspartic peptidase domain-containing protein [Cantharellus anzutake]KAF8315777.1 aspartic peptidase domain-containing protein [Cantharellus anzutake]